MSTTTSTALPSDRAPGVDLPAASTRVMPAERALRPGRKRPPPPPQPIHAASLPDALLKVQTVSAVAGLSAATIYRKVASGEFPEPVRLGQRCTRWKSGAVQAWLAAQTAGPAPTK